MKIRRRTAAAVAGTALLIGGVAAGCAATTSGTGDPQTSQTAGQEGQAGLDTSALVTALVEGLNLDEATVQTAVDDAVASAIGQQGQPPSGEAPEGQASGAPAAPSGDAGQGGSSQGTPGDQGGPGGNNRLAEQLATSIAEALGADEDEVLTIVEANLPAMGRPGGQGGPDTPAGDSGTPSPQPTTSD